MGTATSTAASSRYRQGRGAGLRRQQTRTVAPGQYLAAGWLTRSPATWAAGQVRRCTWPSIVVDGPVRRSAIWADRRLGVEDEGVTHGAFGAAWLVDDGAGDGHPPWIRRRRG